MSEENDGFVGLDVSGADIHTGPTKEAIIERSLRFFHFWYEPRGKGPNDGIFPPGGCAFYAI
jgi:hypothetical protein